MQMIGWVLALAVGIVLGLTGGGGAILTVPILTYLFGVTPSVSTGYSLAIVGVSSLVGSWTYYQRRQIVVHVALSFGLASIVGVLIARLYIVPGIPSVIWESDSLLVGKDHLLMIVFAAFMLFAGKAMLRPVSAEPVARSFGTSKHILGLAASGFTTGVFTGFVGAGGGFIIVPILVSVVGLQMNLAVGTSLAIITMSSIVGFLGSLTKMQEVDWFLLQVFSGLSIAGIIVGSKLSTAIRPQLLKKGFAIAILTIGMIVLTHELYTVVR